MKPEEFPGLEYLRVDSGALCQAAKSLECESFAGLGYEGKGPVMTEYEGYPSVFYVAIFEGGDVVGVVRKILPGPKGLPTVNSFRLNPTNPTLETALGRPEACEDMATTAIKKGFRARYNFACVLNLWRLALRDAIRAGIEDMFTAVEPIVLLHYRNVFHLPLEELGPAQDYLGAPCIPCVLSLQDCASELYVKDVELAAWFEEGAPGFSRQIARACLSQAGAV
jgi:hypothetical protein